VNTKIKGCEILRLNRITQPEEYLKGHDIYLLLRKPVGRNSTTELIIVITLEQILQGNVKRTRLGGRQSWV
jgi:hypothetical protein